MADRETAPSPSPSANNFTIAINLLRQATDILSSGENENNSSASTAAGRSHNPGPPPDRDASVMSDFRNLFSPYAASTGSSLSRAQKASRPPKRGSRPSPYCKPKETWTHDFFCLADPEQDQVPCKSQKLQLQAAGLGRKRWFSGTKTGQ